MERSEVLLGPEDNIEFLKHFMNILLKKLKYRDITCAFGMINLQYEIRIW